VLDLYISPAMHENELTVEPPLSFTCKEPDPVEFASFAAVNFQWGRAAEGLFKRYKDVLFPTIALRQLIQFAVAIDEGHCVAGPSCCPMIGAITLEREVASSCFLPEVRVLLAIPSQVIRQICGSLPGPPLSEDVVMQIEGDCQKYRAWLSREMVEAVRPDLIAVYERSAAASKKPSSRCFLFGLQSSRCSTDFSMHACHSILQASSNQDSQ
jgi:hypothetical protein